MCVSRWHKHKNCECLVATRIERCDDYKQKYPDKVSTFFPVIFMKQFRNSTEFFRQRLDGIEYTTANITIVMAGLVLPCHNAESSEIDELAEVCPFCDDKDVQYQLEQLEEKRVAAVKQKMGGGKNEAELKGKET